MKIIFFNINISFRWKYSNNITLSSGWTIAPRLCTIAIGSSWSYRSSTVSATTATNFLLALPEPSSVANKLLSYNSGTTRTPSRPTTTTTNDASGVRTNPSITTDVRH